jgi:hypothetical protein
VCYQNSVHETNTRRSWWNYRTGGVDQIQMMCQNVETDLARLTQKSESNLLSTETKRGKNLYLAVLRTRTCRRHICLV